MSTPRFYCWDDDGSPGRNLTGNIQNRLKQILVACLVNGYSTKPSAGWTLEHEHANGFTLSNGDGYINFVSNLPAVEPYPAMQVNGIHIYVAESLTDVGEAIIDGANLCSGNYRKGFPEPAGYTRHSMGFPGWPLDGEVSSLQWVLVADNKTFIISCSASTAVDNNNTTRSFTFYAGAAVLDTPAASFIALGGGVYPYGEGGGAPAYCGGFSAPVDVTTGFAQSIVMGAEPYISSSGFSTEDRSLPAPTQLNLQQPRLRAGENLVGRLRGAVYDDLLRSFYGWQGHLEALGFSGANYTDRGKVVEIDGYNYAFARSFAGNSILTDNPVFW